MKKRWILSFMAALALLAACDTTGTPTETPIPAFTNSSTPGAATTAESAEPGDTTYPVPGADATDSTVQPNLQPGTYPTMDLRPAEQAYPTP